MSTRRTLRRIARYGSGALLAAAWLTLEIAEQREKAASTIVLIARRRMSAPLAATEATTLPLQLKADESGLKRFLGFIPMRRGQMTPGSSSLWKVTLDESGEEVPIATTERGLHDDDSPLGTSITVEANTDGSVVNATLHLTTGRTLSLEAPETIVRPTLTSENWRTAAYEQGIVACSDAEHLCASELYSDLVPRDSERLLTAPSWMRASYTLFETLEPDYFAKYSTDDYYINTPSLTSYDRPATYVQYYLVTGDITYLDRARRCWYKVRAGSYWTTDILDGGGRWGVPEQVNFDDTYFLAYLFWNDEDAKTKGIERYINEGTLCGTLSYDWGIATDRSNPDLSLRKFGRFLRIFAWAHRLGAYRDEVFNGQSLVYWATAWKDRILNDYDGWDIGTTGRLCYTRAGVDNVGEVETMVLFHAGILLEGLEWFDERIAPIIGAQRARINACLDYMRTRYVTPEPPGVTPTIEYVDVACYAGGGNIAVSTVGENVCLDLFMARQWAKQGGEAATHAALVGSRLVLEPLDGKTGPYLDLSIVNGANTGQRNVAEKLLDEDYRHAWRNIGRLLAA